VVTVGKLVLLRLRFERRAIAVHQANQTAVKSGAHRLSSISSSKRDILEFRVEQSICIMASEKALSLMHSNQPIPLSSPGHLPFNVFALTAGQWPQVRRLEAPRTPLSRMVQTTRGLSLSPCAA
jgi:hypothetical protein